MRKLLFACLGLCGGLLSAQQRYLSESFQVQVTSDITYGVNIDFLKNADFSDQAQVGADLTDLKTRIATAQAIPAMYYDPADTNTVIKVSDLKMDIYEPMNDTMTERPVILFIHTGNFLPPQVNGSLAGNKTDSVAVEICKRYAARGFVAASVDYRLGWNPLANDPVTGPIERRATLLNAVYRALHDVKESVRYMKADAAAGNTFGIDTTQITLFGDGSGSYIALAYATLDKVEETEIQKFVYPGTSDSSYVQPSLVGDLEGFGGLLNLYVDNGHTTDIGMVVTMGGALPDTSWLEAGDAPMVAFHAVRDPFAPFDDGTVIVPVTNEDVVDVFGANVYMEQANDLGNNASYQGATYNDAYTNVARAKYGSSYSYFLATRPTIMVNQNVEGLFPIVRPLQSNRLDNIGSPWQWWAAGSTPASPRPAAQAKTFIDTVVGYATPRIMVNYMLEGYLTIGINENEMSKAAVYPNPVLDQLYFNTPEGLSVDRIRVMDISGALVKEIAPEEGQRSIELSGLQSGVYLIEFNAGDQQSVKRIVKQ